MTTMSEVSLSPESLAEIDRELSKFPADRRQSALMAALRIAQDEHGWLSPELIEYVAGVIGVPAVRALEVATFYSMYDLEPVGKHKIEVCTNISCMLRGAEDMVRHAEQKLGIKLGETTRDGRITLKMEEECLAGCVGAPMMTVNGHYHENLTAEKIDEILDGLE